MSVKRGALGAACRLLQAAPEDAALAELWLSVVLPMVRSTASSPCVCVCCTMHIQCAELKRMLDRCVPEHHLQAGAAKVLLRPA